MPYFYYYYFNDISEWALKNKSFEISFKLNRSKKNSPKQIRREIWEIGIKSVLFHVLMHTHTPRNFRIRVVEFSQLARKIFSR